MCSHCVCRVSVLDQFTLSLNPVLWEWVWCVCVCVCVCVSIYMHTLGHAVGSNKKLESVVGFFQPSKQGLLVQFPSFLREFPLGIWYSESTKIFLIMVLRIYTYSIVSVHKIMCCVHSGVCVCVHVWVCASVCVCVCICMCVCVCVCVYECVWVYVCLCMHTCILQVQASPWTHTHALSS